MPKRTKEWWDTIGDEKGFVWYFERYQHKGGRSMYIPDDCSECGVCGSPTLGSSPCSLCSNRYMEAIALVEGEE